MTQREFWKAIEARTSKEVADFGYSDIREEDLPGVSTYTETMFTCENLAVAAQAAREAYERFKGSDFEPQADAEGIAHNTASNQQWLNACPAVVAWKERGKWLDFTYSRAVEVSACPSDVWFDPDTAPHAAR